MEQPRKSRRQTDRTHRPERTHRAIGPHQRRHDESPEHADIRLALNTVNTVSRDLICQLGADPSKWLGLPHDTAARNLDIPEETLAAFWEKAAPTIENAGLIARSQREACARADVAIKIFGHRSYPAALYELDRPPPVLFVKGELPTVPSSLCQAQEGLAAPSIAIVGPRRADPYGLEVAALFARRFAEAGLVVVSGFAKGVDKTAHEAAVSVAGGKTLAVLGCGIDYDYPVGHKQLRERVVEHGALLSEFPLGTHPTALNFPIRNRIIAALSIATLVAQASTRSGSLITARLALELGRDVIAVPGRIFDARSKGTNLLLRDGAHVALHPDEVLEALPISVQSTLEQMESNPREESAAVSSADGKRLLDALGSDALAPEALALRAGMGIERAFEVLLDLELEGRARRYPGGLYVAAR